MGHTTHAMAVTFAGAMKAATKAFKVVTSLLVRLAVLVLGVTFACLFVLPRFLIALIKARGRLPPPRERPTQPAVLSTPELGEHKFAIVRGLRLHYVENGPANASTTMLFLHGFPELWYSWKHQLTAAPAQGYRAIALDMRGYNDSDKPAGTAAYDMDELIEDVVGLLDVLHIRQVVLVAHDWGGVVAWRVAYRHPTRVAKLVIANAPHPLGFVRNAGLWQMLRSWYIFVFQLPLLPELFVAANDYQFIELCLTSRNFGVRRPNALTAADIEAYKYSMSRPGALTATINYYRNVLNRPSAADAAALRQPLGVPTLVLWGMEDRALGFELMRGINEWVRDVRVVQLAGVSHWSPQDNIGAFNSALFEFARRA
eukprot:c53784_g1_i1.p2 GENE.c53784_g1_i1~~c53784_g1_i1.p2  ORF type:complete len:371 (+),score=56.38 c53784_g1_i1:10-1122(+)